MLRPLLIGAASLFVWTACEDGEPADDTNGTIEEQDECTTSDDCGDWQLCDNNTCVDSPDAPPETCGDGVVDDGEACDDYGASASCNANCTLSACGDGIVNKWAGEACDDGEKNGTPNHCDTNCLYITEPLCGNGIVEEGEEGDDPEFCDDGERNGQPNQCNKWCTKRTPPVCGNGVVEDGEACDGEGESDACNADCTLAECGDGYVNERAGEICDDGADNGKGGRCNSDCSAVQLCGNGVVDAGEVCDDGPQNGQTGHCNDECSGSGGAICGNGTIEGDEACDDSGESATCNANCTTAVCGDSITNYTSGEACDDGGDSYACTADCNAKDVAFRFDTIQFVDPHLFYSLFGCNDITNDVPLGLMPGGANSILQEGLERTKNGKFNTSLATILRPLNQKDESVGDLDFVFPDCTSPLGECTNNASKPVIMSRAKNQQSGYCLPVDEQQGRNEEYTGLNSPIGPCVISEEMDLDISIRGITLELKNARTAATYNALPATRLVDGVLVGFLPRSAAESAVIPVPDPIGDTPLVDFLKGGNACGQGSDLDVLDGEEGWWFYFNFTAQAADAWNE